MNKKIKDIINIPRMADHAGEEPNFSRGLYQLIKENFKPSFSVIQIGTYEGVTAVLFALTCREVITVDPYADGYLKTQETPANLVEAEKIAKARLAPYANAKMVRMTSEQFYLLFNGEVDAVYIDGDHTEEGVTFDVRHWRNKVKPGGFISGHDWGVDQIQKVVLHCLGKPDGIYEDGSWIKQL